MPANDDYGLDQFLSRNPGMSLRPSRTTEVVLKGSFLFTAQGTAAMPLSDSYCLEIRIPKDFPRSPPTVFEVGGKIPRDADHHVYPNGALCLGSDLRILVLTAQCKTLGDFADRCIVPFLYGRTHQDRYGGEMPFGELEHGAPGTIDDYRDIFGVQKDQQVIEILWLIGTKRRVANKAKCPCGCGKRLGLCGLHLKINCFRRYASRAKFRSQAKELNGGKRPSLGKIKPSDRPLVL